MGGDDDMVKEAVYLGRTVEWSEHMVLEYGQIEDTCGHCCVSWGWRIVEVFLWPRIGWIWEWRQLSSPKPWQFHETVTTNVSNVLQDISIDILTTCNGSCRETRRSNSGGTLQLGDHLIAAWSHVQPRIALSSGEAELYAGMRGMSETVRSHDA